MAANVRFINPKTMAKPPGYTYVVEATGPNRLIFHRRPARPRYSTINWSARPATSARNAFKAFENLKLRVGSGRRQLQGRGEDQ